MAAIGGGVIGAGWIARFLLNGHDVKVFDPNPQAERIVGEVLANATRAYQKLTLAPLPEKGKLTFVATLAEAVQGADYIQESVPERIELKRNIYAQIEAHAPSHALVGSSTSGFKPSELMEGLTQLPARFFVAHPFNPVYLLPLVELVPCTHTRPQSIDFAEEIFNAIGMKPLLIKKEIDAHIADRLLEAVWREGLWLVHDGIATTQEIDDAIRYGFGLRWAQMGLFETYRIAGGEAGMEHFIRQFGPALKWPWTKLMDVPELTDALIETIASQSDAQSGHHSIRDLERIRDDNLVAIMQALKAADWGAGNALKIYENSLYSRAHAHLAHLDGGRIDEAAPLWLHRDRVREDFVDYNGHMTESRYLQIFGDATDAFLIFIGMDQDYLAGGHSFYTVETHLRHLREVKMGVEVRIATRLLGFDEKRLRILHEMYGEQDELLATAEHMLLHVNSKESSACPALPAIKENLSHLWAGQKQLEMPDYAGRAIRHLAMDG